MAPAQVVDDVDVVDMHQEDDENMEQRLINEEYKTWKKNSPFLYDMILSTFPGDGGEISQLDKIYNVMGTPNKAEWPGLIDMPWFELLRPGYRRASSFAAKYRDKLTPAAYDLIWSIFKYDPAKRPSAAEALQHAYFTTEEPPARQAVELANLDGDWHELESKALRKENERKEREARHAARSKDGRDHRQKEKDRKRRKRENETHDQRGDAKRLHVEGKPPQPVDHATAAAAHKA
ncbi:hypothetical protein BN1723_008784 [Verticillium longisporum]|uniref:Histone-binding protein RBBP4-like N-terminal domain-containing protein n=1 Tax=Verticillium longisporum TaxID=100787 RepID=A0A0G4KIC3_VERLO|nr:hypothetical protein BN1723_008784 [Verticillium longisporum]